MPSNSTVFHWKPCGCSRWTIGVYRWSRSHTKTRHGYVPRKRGIVLRFGPLGHVQFQTWRAVSTDGRVPRRSLMVSWWGVRGRRRKRYIELAVGR